MSDFYPYYKAKYWHLVIEYVPHYKDSYKHGDHKVGYDKDHYIIYDEYRQNGHTLEMFEITSYADGEVRSKEEAFQRFKDEYCHGQSRFRLKEFQERSDRVYDKYHSKDIKKSYKTKLIKDKVLVDMLEIDEIYDEIEESARFYTSELNRLGILNYTEAGNVYKSCIEHFNDNIEVSNLISDAAAAKTVADQAYLLDEIEDEIRSHVDGYVKERGKSLDRSLTL